MSGGRRVAVVLGAAAVAVVAFVLLNPGGGDDDAERTESPSVRTRTVTTSEPPPATRTPPEVPVLGGGSVRTIEVRRGERARFVARSERAEEVHVHGYDLSKDVEAGGSVSFDFRATIEGIFEIEYELSHEQIGRLVVKP